ncbi:MULTISPECIES: PAS domain-containing protein [unclassified Pseudomonas]|uniref:PAS domain-containing protein n=1 Tax=unclassified Pseudomonas TaxID=196821 RepID=UPI002AC9DB04|nr:MULTISPECIES: PAS domain-containing protein [unclassified Pseudomonas]MEB0042730.1 PAS domain-containing protein [Pseudomonas sp. MH10]MEB0079910.1 PAS domain-containing protein [Pseudomonas sp. MH10out]MEB0093807.1 PAS domain-containing protein [Pseudomonas sp. CCI4.2]MEB0103500.1 PAS domain-containing protein [Pseudomonas sp. CCI3.2]MEB0121671.1 PAS domain-containing protein [Pseudomonas sp. CCI1.2]
MINAKLLQLVINASNDGIVVAEQEGDDNILIYANKAFEALTGYQVDDILYRDCRFLQSGDRDQPGLELIRQAIAAGSPCRTVLRNYRKDGTAFWNELSITPVFNAADQLTYFIGIQKNVTEQVEAQLRVVELEAELALARAEIIVLKSISGPN